MLMAKDYTKIKTPSAVVFAGAVKKGCRLEYRARTSDRSSGWRITAEQAKRYVASAALFRILRADACRRGQAATAYQGGLITASKSRRPR